MYLTADDEASKRKQAKDWCFTINNPLENEDYEVFAIPHQYLVFGYEVGESGTPHLQGFIQFASKVRFQTVKGYFPRAYLSIRRGTPQEASTYCKKEGRFIEDGRLSYAGKRTDLDDIKEFIQGGATDQEVAETNFSQWCYHRKSFSAYRSMLFPPTDRDDVRVVCIWGITGSGKTATARAIYPDAYVCVDPSLRLFDGYDEHREIILDEFDASASRSVLLRLLDRYKCSLRILYGWVPLRAVRFIITSNFPPSQWGY